MLLSIYRDMTEYAKAIISPESELIVLFTNVLLMILLYFSYIFKNKSIKIVTIILTLNIASAIFNLSRYAIMIHHPSMHVMIYVLRELFYISISLNIIFARLYLGRLLRIKKEYRTYFKITPFILLLIAIIVDNILSFTKNSFYITSDNMIRKVSVNPFIVLSVILYIEQIVSVLYSRNKIARRTTVALLSALVICFSISFASLFRINRYLITFSIMVPVITIIIIFHTGSYNIDTSMAGLDVFINQLGIHLEKKRNAIIFSCYVKSFKKRLAEDPKFYEAYNNFISGVAVKGVLSSIDSEHAVLMIKKNKRGIEEIRPIITDKFAKYFKGTDIIYKWIYLETIPEITRPEEYIDLISETGKRMKNNTAYEIGDEDYSRYLRKKYILEQLKDIRDKNDALDPRVLVYAQPIFNIKENAFLTAEALMRLELPEIGMVFPNEFIELAETNKLIHPLFNILLNKLCKVMRGLIDGGYKFNLITANLSVVDMEEIDIVDEVSNVLNKYGIPYDKLGIEITESLLIDDFESVKAKILNFNNRNMKIYLDDFGSGYSNLDRILALPFDVVKFDRSLVLQADSNEKGLFMVKSMANILAEMDYTLLFEGVETKEQNTICDNIGSTYIQGYLYSKPVPIEELFNKFEK